MKTTYPDQLDYWGRICAPACQRTGAGVFVPRFERGISRVLGERHNQARPYERASNEDRTRDLALTKRMLCQLSYGGDSKSSNKTYNVYMLFFF